MLLGMMKWQKGVLPFTILVALIFLMSPASAQTTGDVAPEEAAPPAEVPPAPAEAPVVDSQAYYMDTDPSAVTLWRPELEPYGVWVEDPVYGLVWVPDANAVGADFVPYVTAGHWGYTAEGDWLWVSDYEWGWVAFHYGRWVWIPERGWAWIPGRLYAPAWVVWRVGDPGYDYVGWAPMPPTYYWYGGVAVAFWVVPPPYYVYCESRYVFVHDVHRHRLRGHRARGAANHTSPYRPARPGKGADRHAARPSRGPSHGEAGVPPEVVPRTPATPHPRATAAAKPASHAASSVRPTARASSRVSGVSQPKYRGRPSGSVPVERRAAPLASRPALRSPTRSTDMPARSSRSLGRTTAPSYGTGRGWSDRPGASTRTPSPSSRPSARTARPGYAPVPRTQPPSRTSRPYPSATRPSGRTTRPSARPSDRTTRPSNQSRPSYGSSRPSYRAPAGSSSGSGYNNGNNNNNNNRGKSRGRAKGRGRRR